MRSGAMSTIAMEARTASVISLLFQARQCVAGESSGHVYINAGKCATCANGASSVQICPAVRFEVTPAGSRYVRMCDDAKRGRIDTE